MEDPKGLNPQLAKWFFHLSIISFFPSFIFYNPQLVTRNLLQCGPIFHHYNTPVSHNSLNLTLNI